MGQKVNPHGARVGVIFDWSTRWFAEKKDFANHLVEDFKLREMLKNKFYSTGISRSMVLYSFAWTKEMNFTRFSSFSFRRFFSRVSCTWWKGCCISTTAPAGIFLVTPIQSVKYPTCRMAFAGFVSFSVFI